jgi:hypothetical protein
MATPTIQTGANSTLVYYWEDGLDGFKGDPDDSTPKPFGKDSSLSAFEGSRNAVELFEPNSREVEQWIEQEFSGSWTADFVFSNPWWNRGALTTPSTTGSSAPYTHEFDGEDPSSMQIITGNTRSGEDWLLCGAVVSDVTISIEVPGNVTVSLSGAYSALEETEPSTQEAQASRSAEVFTFADAQLSIGGTVQRLIQSLTFTIANNTDPVLELGAEEPVDFSPKSRMLTVDHVQTRDDSSDDAIDRFLGGSSTLSAPTEDAMTLRLDNGKSGSEKQTVKYDLSGAFPNEFSISNTGDPDSDIENSVTNRSVGVTCTAENDVETAP